MTAPTPAAVRAAMKLAYANAPHNIKTPLTEDEKRAFLSDTRREEGILADHIRAIAEEMRDCANLHRDCGFPDTAKDLSDFADRLEGKQS